MIDSLFGSKTRVKLLHLFLNSPGSSFYVREITRLIDEQINSVRRELANMMSVGIICSDNIDNKLYYSLNENYEYVGPLKAIFSDKKSLNEPSGKSGKTWIDMLSAVSGLKIAISAGRLVNDMGSEIDILLVGDLSQSVTAKIIKRIEKMFGGEINYAVMTYEDFYYRLSVRDRFIMGIMGGKHIVLVDKENILGKE